MLTIIALHSAGTRRRHTQIAVWCALTVHVEWVLRGGCINTVSRTRRSISTFARATTLTQRS
jgi:hypothetical protein